LCYLIIIIPTRTAKPHPFTGKCLAVIFYERKLLSRLSLKGKNKVSGACDKQQDAHRLMTHSYTGLKGMDKAERSRKKKEVYFPSSAGRYEAGNLNMKVKE
jgi:hypothetical protein